MVDKRFFGFSGALTLGDLLSGAGLPPDSMPENSRHLQITNAAPLDGATREDISLAASASYAARLEQTKAGAVVVSDKLAGLVPDPAVAVVVPDPHGLFVKILNHLFPPASYRLADSPDVPELGDPELEDGVRVGANVVLGSGVRVGTGTVIGPNTVIGPGVHIGRNCRVGANVTLECCLLGDDVVIGHGACVGVEGFGWLDHGRTNIKVPQLGRAILQSGVELGANTSIDRGALGDTLIGEGAKIGAMVEIGHNCSIGRNCLLAPMVGLAGGTVFEDGVLAGPNVGSAGHLTIGAGSVLHARCAVTKDWPAGSTLAGAPAQDIKEFWRELAVVRRLAKGKSN